MFLFSALYGSKNLKFAIVIDDLLNLNNNVASPHEEV
jgi:hypothetical protein